MLFRNTWRVNRNKEVLLVFVLHVRGFIVNPNFPWLGASPDFLINDSNEQASSLGLGEVKCPYSKRGSTIKEL
jgi:hypothetical protein